MNIQERKNKDGKITSYRIRVFDHRDSTTGKQIFKTLSVKYNPDKSETWNRKNAEKEAAVFESKVEEQTISDARITFDNYADYFIKIKLQAGVASSTERIFLRDKRKLAPFIGHIQLKNLTAPVLNKAYGEMLNSGFTNSGVHHLDDFIHNVMQLALKEGIIPRNYADATTPPKAEKKSGRIIRLRRKTLAISEDDLECFFNVLYADEGYKMQQVFFTVLLATGCRIGELCALKWSNIDFDEGRIHICRHFVNDKNGWHIEDGCKTSAGERWLYMDESIMDLLRDYRKYYLALAKEYGSKWNAFSDAVFCSLAQNSGDFVRPQNMQAWLRGFLKKHKLPHITPHQFRHTAISLQLQAGVSVPEAAKRAGHTRPSFTLATYAHTLKNNDRHCCEAVTKVLPKIPKIATG